MTKVANVRGPVAPALTAGEQEFGETQDSRVDKLLRARGRSLACVINIKTCGRRHLQHRRALARRQPCDQNDLAAGKFERVVVNVRIGHVDLAEASDFVPDSRLAEQAERAIVLHGVLEGELGAGHETHGDIGFSDCGKAASDRSGEIRRDQRVAYFGRP